MANTYTEQARRAARRDPLTAALPAGWPGDTGPSADDGAGGWRVAGLCSQVDPELFFPEKGSSNAAARAVCRGCPVKLRCLAEAVDDGSAGVWGESSELERRELRRFGWTGDRIRAYAAANGGAVPFTPRGGRKALVVPYEAPTGEAEVVDLAGDVDGQGDDDEVAA